MTNHLMEEVTDESIECFYLFLDTNLFYSEKVTYDIFDIKLMTDLLRLRNSFNMMFSGYRKIEILIPKLVVDEIYSIKSHIIQSKISPFKNIIQHLDEKSLISSLERIYDNIHVKLDSSGNCFFQRIILKLYPIAITIIFPLLLKNRLKKIYHLNQNLTRKRNVLLVIMVLKML